AWCSGLPRAAERGWGQGSEALDTSWRRKISLCECSEWVTRCSTWATSASKRRVSGAGVDVSVVSVVIGKSLGTRNAGIRCVGAAAVFKVPGGGEDPDTDAAAFRRVACRPPCPPVPPSRPGPPPLLPAGRPRGWSAQAWLRSPGKRSAPGVTQQARPRNGAKTPPARCPGCGLRPYRGYAGTRLRRFWLFRNAPGKGRMPGCDACCPEVKEEAPASRGRSRGTWTAAGIASRRPATYQQK